MLDPVFLHDKEALDAQIAAALPAEPSALTQAMRYGLLTPGKRIRGVLTLELCRRLNVSDIQSLPFAAALEMIHAYSLIHDDMPEMDNDDLRRGQPTCHKKFGSALALLAGDGVLNYAIEYLLEKRALYEAPRFLAALEALFTAAGYHGMLEGQALDMQAESNPPDLGGLLLLHQKKTGALLTAPAQIACALSGQENEHYVNYCRHIGLAFQIKDDLLDVEGNPEELGKATGKDQLEQKTTFVSLLGAEGARLYLEKELNAAKACAANDSFLVSLADYIGLRQK